MRIAIYGSRHQAGYINYIIRLVEALRRRGAKVVMAEKLFCHITNEISASFSVNEVVAADQKCPDADMAFSIGGDGTFLRTAQWAAPHEIPILGINTGHLGYLADHRLEADFEWLDLLFAGGFDVQSRSMIRVSGLSDEILDSFWPYALNEIAVLKKDTASMIDVEAYVDDDFLAHYKADGLIVATPTGSTGYNLSVGGPILQPTAPVNVLSPVAAHSLSMRPLVLGATSVVRMRVSSRAGSFLLSVDGRSLSLSELQDVIVSPAPFVTKVLIRPDRNFAETLRKKLYWGVLNGR